VIPIVSEVEKKSDNSKSKNTKKKFKISPTIKCYKWQCYGHIAANCLNPFKIDISDGVLIEAPSLIVLFIRKSLM